MSRSTFTLPNSDWLRKARSWFGVLLMVVSLFGGYRAAARVMEETETEAASEVLEYAHRLADSSQRSHGRRTRSGDTPPTLASQTSEPSRSTHQHNRAAKPAAGHLLANGLRAPLRC